jgi:hypothetical protein
VKATYTMIIGLLLVLGCTLRPSRPTVYTDAQSEAYNACEAKHAECLARVVESPAATEEAPVRRVQPGWDSNCNDALKRCYKRAQTSSAK